MMFTYFTFTWAEFHSIFAIEFKIKTMKTSIKISALIIATTITFSINLIANSTLSPTAKNVKSDTSFIVEPVNHLTNPANTEIEFDFEEEKYIDDIPFDTECVSANCLFNEAMNTDFYFEEEKYIDDTNLPIR